MNNILKQLNLSQTTNTYVSLKLSKLESSENNYIESLILNEAIKKGYSFTPLEIENLRLQFLSGAKPHITYKFRSQISTFPLSAQIKIIHFLCRINLLEGYKINTGTVASLSKTTLICFFSLGKIGRSFKLVDNYIKSYPNVKIYTLGPANASSNEYLFFSNKQMFMNNYIYPLFSNLLINLGILSNTDVIKVHYSNLDLIYYAIKSI